MKGKQLTDEQLMQAFRKQPDEQAKQTAMVVHRDTMDKLVGLIKEKSIADIIETEQLILSGVNEKLEPQSGQAVLKAVKSSVEKRVKANMMEEAIRIVCLLLLTYTVPEKDYKDLLKQVGNSKAVKVVRSLYQSSGSECSRLKPAITEDEKRQYLANYEGIGLRKYDCIKMKPKIVEIVD